jgi:hypothetical protein
MPPPRTARTTNVAAFSAFVDDREVLQLLADRFPKVTNRELNRACGRTGKEFVKGFAARSLVRGIFQVRRRASGKASGLAIPAKARAAGISAGVIGPKKIEGKGLRISTSNPLLVIRELGGTIRPKDAVGLLIIRGEFLGRGAAGRKARFFTRQEAQPGSRRFKRPVARRVRKVEVPPILRFRAQWDEFQPRLRALFNDGMARAVASVIRVRQAGLALR